MFQRCLRAAPDGITGDWWFWFGWAERIAPTGTPGTAAMAIINELRRQPDIPWDRRPSAAAPAAAGDADGDWHFIAEPVTASPRM